MEKQIFFKIEIKVGRKYFNERGSEICGYMTPLGMCRNPPNCRFHCPHTPVVPRSQYVLSPKIKGAWMEYEHLRFLNAIQRAGLGRWHEISGLVGTRTAGQCQIHFYKQKTRLGVTDEQYMNDIDVYGPMTLSPTTQKYQRKLLSKQKQIVTQPEKTISCNICNCIQREPPKLNVQIDVPEYFVVDNKEKTDEYQMSTFNIFEQQCLELSKQTTPVQQIHSPIQTRSFEESYSSHIHFIDLDYE